LKKQLDDSLREEQAEIQDFIQKEHSLPEYLVSRMLGLLGGAVKAPFNSSRPGTDNRLNPKAKSRIGGIARSPCAS